MTASLLRVYICDVAEAQTSLRGICEEMLPNLKASDIRTAGPWARLQ